MSQFQGLYCCITYPDGMGYNTIGSSVFDAAAKALEWVEVDCPWFGTARRYRDGQVLVTGVGRAPDRRYRGSSGANPAVDPRVRAVKGQPALMQNRRR